MLKTAEILSKITVFNKYSKYLPDFKRRETFDEICDRYETMMIEKYPLLEDDIRDAMMNVRGGKILPSMRGLQFAGPAIKRNESRVYNCAFLPVDDYRAFSEAMFLLLGGTGIGYSVQSQDIAQLPPIMKPTKTQKYVIEDSIEGWADAIKHLMKAYFGKRLTKPRFSYDSIRAKGERLVTSGGKAPGAEPLKRCLFLIEQLLERKESGTQLTSLEAHDIMCHLADAVLAGGIRRAAMISLFSPTDTEMVSCKTGNWWELNPQRGRANNSAVIHRKDKDAKEQFEYVTGVANAGGYGEPGIYFTNDISWGTNPCCEIALRPFQFCNLCEVNASDVENQEDLEDRVTDAAFLGTLQAGFTDFHYLRDIWRKTTEEDALIGVGITGIGSNKLRDLDLKLAADVAKEVNAEMAEFIGINPAARVTTIKPSGTTSCVLGCSSGIHAWYDKYYLRRIQLNSVDPLVPYFKKEVPSVIKPYNAIPGSYVLEIPQMAPKDAILRDESALAFLTRVRRFYQEWVQPGHREGNNTNNVSATVSVKPEEWKDVQNWMWANRDFFNGLSILPHDGGKYEQAPFETITKEEYDMRLHGVKGIDLTQVKEEEDITDQAAELACAGGSCEII